MKLKAFFTLLCSLVILQVSAQQQVKPDMVKTNKGQLKIQPITHGTLVLSWNGKTIYVDPYGGAELYKGIAKPDLILITDIHPDHLDTKTLDGLDLKGAKMVVPQAVADQLPEKYKGQAEVIGNGQSTNQLGIPIAAIPMYNLPEAEDSKHVKGRGNGYVLNIGGKNIYISGDTEDIPEMRALKNIDVAFVSMNLPYTMDINQAASGVLEFKPKVIYPYHYRGTDGLADVESFKKMVNEKDANIEVRLRNWYPTEAKKK
ncbi:MBL fold metallo-hydrolase [Pontibacter sp. KCTC 32443]|uniref:MBL fold metallo-hydrolase n=1 Tax=Pontibacter TaxID=323449 RepID=UPI00164ED599|nr:MULTISPECIES: MBL fold metallo-hydrolase [Pontibacter]MBC5773434.1 MBL fold metallo-hydrolase [Pontibacter sp. KCTC 32443]